MQKPSTQIANERFNALAIRDLYIPCAVPTARDEDHQASSSYLGIFRTPSSEAKRKSDQHIQRRSSSHVCFAWDCKNFGNLFGPTHKRGMVARTGMSLQTGFNAHYFLLLSSVVCSFGTSGHGNIVLVVKMTTYSSNDRNRSHRGKVGQDLALGRWASSLGALAISPR